MLTFEPFASLQEKAGTSSDTPGERRGGNRVMDSGAALTTSSLACGTGGSKASEEELDLEVPFYFVSTWFTVTDGGPMSSGSHQVPVAKTDCDCGRPSAWVFRPLCTHLAMHASRSSNEHRPRLPEHSRARKHSMKLHV